jgi:hypothetical protein
MVSFQTWVVVILVAPTMDSYTRVQSFMLQVTQRLVSPPKDLCIFHLHQRRGALIKECSSDKYRQIYI